MYNNKEKESTAREGVAWVGSTMQVDDERNGRSLLAIKGEARIVGGRGEESLLCDPGSEVRPGRREKRRAIILNGKKKNKERCWVVPPLPGKLTASHFLRDG